jgi:hypothetical protein
MSQENNVTSQEQTATEAVGTTSEASSLPAGDKRVVVDPITRIEGHLRA